MDRSTVKMMDMLLEVMTVRVMEALSEGAMVQGSECSSESRLELALAKMMVQALAKLSAL